MSGMRSRRRVVLLGGLILASSACGSAAQPVKTGTTGAAGTTGVGGTAGSSTDGGAGSSASQDAAMAPTGKNILMVVGDSNESNPVGTTGTAKGTGPGDVFLENRLQNVLGHKVTML